MRNQIGQVILGLILVMVIALGIGLSVVQRSLVDISTSSKVEDSSRAFSAAEAGIEKALKSDTTAVNFAESRSSATVYDSGPLPVIPSVGNRQDPLAYPSLAKEEVAHFWLADFTSTTNPPAVFYNPSPLRQLDVYWGNSATDKAALELTLVSHDGTSYLSRKWYLDQISRTPPNNFEVITCGGHVVGSNTYQCKRTIGASPDTLSLPTGLMLLRTRLLYNSTSQPVAIQAVGTCGQSCSIPSQVKLLTSVGISGETQRRIQVFQIEKVVPPYFDFAIFSAGVVGKQ